MNRQVINNVIQGKPIKDGTWDIRKPKSKRSSQQNRYLHGVVLKILAEYCGYTIDEMKIIIKEKYELEFFTRFHNINGHGYNEHIGTSDLSTIECANLCKQIQIDFADMVYIPDPDSVDFDAIYQMYKRD